MREIVTRLHENRQVELAKSILESNGYEVSKSERLNEFYETPMSNPAVMKACKDLGITFNYLEFKHNDPEYSNSDSYTMTQNSKSISGAENRLNNLPMIYSKINNFGSTDRYLRDYASSSVLIFFDYSDPLKSKLVIVPRTDTRSLKDRDGNKIKNDGTPALESHRVKR